MEKYVPGDYEFDVPKKLIELYNSKDYGTYKNAAGKIPLALRQPITPLEETLEALLRC
jgi:hypothetical protein